MIKGYLGEKVGQVKESSRRPYGHGIRSIEAQEPHPGFAIPFDIQAKI